MMGLSMGSPGREELAASAAAMALPDETKKVLADISAQFSGLAAKRTELAAAAAKIDADRKAVDVRMVELQARSDALDARDAALAARAARLQSITDAFEQRLGEHATALEQTP